jgi:AcrR family transcriptional regulator
MSSRSERHGPLPAGRHRLSREFVLHSQRDRILESIARACVEKGYEKVTIADIVTTARVSRATFYDLFRDKEECLLAAFDFVLSRFMKRMLGAYRRRGEGWPERVRAGIGATLEFLADEPHFAWMCVVEAPAAGARAVDRYMGVVALLSSGIDEGRSHSPAGETIPAGFANAMVGGAAMLVREEIIAGRTAELPALTRDLAYAVLAPFVGRDGALAVATKDLSTD